MAGASVKAHLFKWLAPLLGNLIALYGVFMSGQPALWAMAGITLWVALWWLTDAVEIGIASLIPFVMIPLYGIGDAREIASQYMDPVIFLFLGGFILSLGIEKWGLHQRIALKVLSRIGKSPFHILAGLMITSFFLSMWISNTATVLMLLAATRALFEEYNGSGKTTLWGTALFIGLAYSASIGGMATLVGTPTNMIFSGYYNSHLVNGTEINFSNWFMVGFPIALLILLVSLFVLKSYAKVSAKGEEGGLEIFKTKYRALGAVSTEEKIILLVFLVTSLLWFSRADLDLGFVQLRGWSSLFEHKKYLHDGIVAIFMACLLFLIPTKRGGTLLNGEDLKRIPLEIMLLFGGGFALAKGFELSGLGAFIAKQLTFMQGLHPLLLIFAIVLTVTIISEFASNVASIQLALPVLQSLAVAIDIHPLTLMIPATLAASLGFVLPIATAPNTIVFGTGLVPVKGFLHAGLRVDLLGIVIISLLSWLLMPYLFG
jgi:sodium-dependent dicarboxylate transporter 2/3/5